MARLSRRRQSARRCSLAAPGEAPGSDARFLPTLTGHPATALLEPSQQREPPGKGQGQHNPGAPLPAPLGDAVPGTAGGRGALGEPGPAGPGNAKLGFTPWTPLS